MHKQALLNTLKMILTAGLTGFVVGFLITALTATQATFLVCGLLIALGFWMIYPIEKDRLERLDRLNKSVDKAQ